MGVHKPPFTIRSRRVRFEDLVTDAVTALAQNAPDARNGLIGQHSDGVVIAEDLLAPPCSPQAEGHQE